MAKATDVWAPFMSGKELQAKMVGLKTNQNLSKQLEDLVTKYSAAK
ncbi:MAG: hypothetical protein HYY30_05165 [Chloroflexi bacterium]|nr:hypothetical protein [Chloroflexota bacterium]